MSLFMYLQNIKVNLNKSKDSNTISSMLGPSCSCHITDRQVEGIRGNWSADYGFLCSLMYVATQNLINTHFNHHILQFINPLTEKRSL